MDVKGVNLLDSTPKQVESKHQETVQRVQAEFLNQVYSGKKEHEAFRESLKAVDEKYNPKEDCVAFSMETPCKEAIGASYKFAMPKMPSGETIVNWLNFISLVLPKILEIIDMIPKPEKNTPEPTATPLMA